MSATRRKGIGLKDDFFETPPWAFEWLERCVGRRHPPGPPKTILEPGAGNGSLVRELRRHHPDATIYAVEKRAECKGHLLEAGADVVHIGDFLEWEPRAGLRFDLVLGNPPYGGPKFIKGVGRNPHYELWLRFVKRGLELLDDDGKLTFVLRVGILEGEGRNEWMRKHVPHLYVLPKRPKFTGAGSDSATYAWMVWHPGECRLSSIRILEHLGDVDRVTGRTVKP